MSTKTDNILTGVFRLAFPDLVDPKPNKNGRITYTFKMIVPKGPGQYLTPPVDGSPADHESTMKELRKLAYGALKAEYGDQKIDDGKGNMIPNPKWPADLRLADLTTHVSGNGKDGWPIRNGDSVTWDGFKDCFFMKAGSGFKIPFVDSSTTPIINMGEVRGGLLCRAQINAYIYEVDGNKGVTFGCSCVQVLKDDGVSFSGVGDPSKVFGKYGAPAGSIPAATSAAGAKPATGGYDPFAV